MVLLILLNYAAIAQMVFWIHMIRGSRSMKLKLIFICFFFIIILPGCVCIGSDTISDGQSLFPNQTIISKGGKFELGFFVQGNSTYFYVGIWYANIPVRTIVWVANRNYIIPYSFYNSSKLKLSNGSLYLYVNSEKVEISRETTNATEAVILDTGNFVLRNASGIIWQSFDYPTDTWLPGGRLGISSLNSWKSPNDPASGVYFLGLEPNEGIELFISTYAYQRVWRSGVLRGGTFSSLSDKSNFSNSFTYTSRDGRVYLTYNAYSESVMSRIVIDDFGQMKLFVWPDATQGWLLYWAQPSNICNNYAMCGANGVCNIKFSPLCGCLDGFVPKFPGNWEVNDFSGGCVRRMPLLCAEVNAEFIKVTNIKLPKNSESLGVMVRSGVCDIVCSASCSCNAYAYGGGGECLLFMGDLLDLKKLSDNSTGEEIYVRMDAGRPRKGKREVPPLAIAVPIGVAILISCICLYSLRRKHKRKELRGAYQDLLLLDLSTNGSANHKRTSVGNNPREVKNNRPELPIFSFSSIATSTNDFSITNKLGEGGFGPVYMGKLLNGQFVAVKRLSKKSGQGLQELKNETELIAKLQHINLVGILGCCIENDEKILVYEYMPNKCLDFFLFEPTKKELLGWTRRVHIIEGIAQGILYLHHYSRLRIVHRDLKASNILLDAEMNPKISDFGMARIFGGNDSQANTKRIVGTYGYMSPEYAMEGLFSVKSDVFAFGVLMLEIVSGKRNTGFYGSEYLSLLGYAWNMWKHDRGHELVDPTLEITSSSTALRYIQIGLLCVQERPADRPLMSDIVAMLNNDEPVIASPQHPAFTVGRSAAKVEICSVNDLTISQMEAR